MPATILKKNNKDNSEEYIFTVLENSFEKKVLKKYVEEIFKNYSNQEEIKIDEFFGEHLLTLKNDKTKRKDFVEQYIQKLTPNDIRELFKLKKKKK